MMHYKVYLRCIGNNRRRDVVIKSSRPLFNIVNIDSIIVDTSTGIVILDGNNWYDIRDMHDQDAYRLVRFCRSVLHT
jgi:hypothetical protein